jgi:mannose/cellobiose epimerase-like protein (N-acyl-D-glucosamine 2-epimerase family)
MHLLEAFRALYAHSGCERWKALAEELAGLCRDRFIDSAMGALLEYFTDELVPLPGVEGTILEPGHCFEWAWLFERLVDWGWACPSSEYLRQKAAGFIPSLDDHDR